MARSLNRVQLIGNLTRDPELRYTPNGNAVCSFGIATNRTWTTDAGEKREEVDFHNIIAWNKLGELCSQFLTKGRKVYVEGRLSTRSWTGQDGQQKTRTEIIISDMILLDNKFQQGTASTSNAASAAQTGSVQNDDGQGTKSTKKKQTEEVKEDRQEEAPVAHSAGHSTLRDELSGSDSKSSGQASEEVMPDDIPF